MASYEEVRQTQLFYVGYICSRCKAVTAAEAMLVAVGRAPFKKGAHKAVDKAYADGMERIRNGHIKPYRVKTVYEFSNETGFNSYGAHYVEHLTSSCPCCGNREGWLAPASVFVPEDYYSLDYNTKNLLKTGIPEESRPRYFPSREHVLAWKRETLDRMQAENSAYWRDHVQDAKRLKYELNTKIVQIVDYQRMKENVGGKQAELKQAIERKSAEAKQYSLFSRERKAVNAEVKTLEKQLTEQRASDEQMLRHLNSQISSLEMEKAQMLSANPGLIGTTRIVPSPTPMLFEVERLD